VTIHMHMIPTFISGCAVKLRTKRTLKALQLSAYGREAASFKHVTRSLLPRQDAWHRSFRSLWQLSCVGLPRQSPATLSEPHTTIPFLRDTMTGSKSQDKAASQQLPLRNNADAAQDNATPSNYPLEETDTERAAQIAQLDITELIEGNKKINKRLESDFGGDFGGQGGSTSAKEFYNFLGLLFQYNQKTDEFIAAVEAVKKPTAAAMEEARKKVPKASSAMFDEMQEMRKQMRDMSLVQDREREAMKEMKKDYERQLDVLRGDFNRLQVRKAKNKKTQDKTQDKKVYDKEVAELRRRNDVRANRIPR